MIKPNSTPRDLLLTAIGGAEKPLLFVPDYTLQVDRDPIEIARKLDVPAWVPVKPWNLEYGLPTEDRSSPEERSVEWHTQSRTLTARWTLGPDGDWWQTEYPVKDEEDLSALADVVDSISLIPDTEGFRQKTYEIGNNGLVVSELPMQPYSFLLHHFLGWTEGLMLAMMNGDIIANLRSTLEDKFNALVSQMVGLDAEVFLYPDNLDAQFVPPSTFEEHLLKSYALCNEILHGASKRTVVHVGGMIRPILKQLASTSVDVIEGVCGPPQSDADLKDAREIAGDTVILWGGIAQDFVLETYSQEAFANEVGRVLRDAESLEGVIIGIADKVPVGVLEDRLTYIGDKVKS